MTGVRENEARQNRHAEAVQGCDRQKRIHNEAIDRQHRGHRHSLRISAERKFAVITFMELRRRSRRSFNFHPEL